GPVSRRKVTRKSQQPRDGVSLGALPDSPDGAEHVRCVPQRVGVGVQVQPRGDVRGRVPQPRGDGRQRDASRLHQGRARVTGIV
ncbi:hypothetical protein OFC87_34145, partial [Escherichia coli]|nr:hypothetical protein [Escherichia coli]